ncbi:hypothetical protein E4U42_007955 [Claviceps africana]|uniref:Uncharacterized protein n=1 Tax=Claviceps africana TaxID=83212 RepID=A0A8K0NI63_9HYPO|nr:hypothetical protein E4U42_007955 [Claviceps africana]
MPSARQESTPLVRQEEEAVVPTPVTRLQYLASSVIAALHLLRGVALFTSPSLVLAGFALPSRSGPALFLTCLLGLRDVVLGGLVAAADARRGYEVQRALGMALFSDSVDTFVLIFVVACSWTRRNPVLEIVSVALLAMLEHLTLWSFGDDDDDMDGMNNGNGTGTGALGPTSRPSYQAIVQVERIHDRRRRLGMWLEDLKRADDVQLQAEVERPVERDETLFSHKKHETA